MLLRSVPVTCIIGVGLHNDSVRNIFLHQFLYPGTRNDIGPVRLSGMQFHASATHDVAAHLLIRLFKPLRTQVAGKIHYGLVAGPLLIRHILVAVLPGHRTVLP